MILVDTLEKKWSHIEKKFITHKVQYQMLRLKTGDYIRKEDGSIIIDRKRGLQEVAGNLSREKRSKDGTREHKHRDRFVDEIKRARADNARFIVLIEGSGCKSVKDIAQIGRLPYGKMTGAQIVEQMFRLECAYGVEWMFCETKDTWQVICDLLGEEYEHKQRTNRTSKDKQPD